MIALASEFSGGVGIEWQYDTLGHLEGVTLKRDSTVLAQQSYGYSSTHGRLETAAYGPDSVVYSYHANSDLPQNLAFKNGGTTRFTAIKSCDFNNRPTSFTWTAGISRAYQNKANTDEIERTTFGDGSYFEYTYDSLGQVTGGRKRWANNRHAAGQQFDYGFDEWTSQVLRVRVPSIDVRLANCSGNRKFSGKGGNDWGTNLRYSHYTANDLNQYTSKTTPGHLGVIGSADPTATVTLDSNPAIRNGGLRFQLRIKYVRRSADGTDSYQPRSSRSFDKARLWV